MSLILSFFFVAVSDAADLELPKTTVQRLAKSSVRQKDTIHLNLFNLLNGDVCFAVVSCLKAQSLPKSRE
jgi:histone H3/H4